MFVIRLLFFLICFNLVCATMNYCFPVETVAAGLPSAEAVEKAIAEVESWNPVFEIPIVGDIVKGFAVFVSTVKGVVFGFPSLLESLGLPSPLVHGAYVLTALAYVFALLYIISGRGVED